MNVGRAVKITSMTVSVALPVMISLCQLPSTAKPTAEFLEKWFRVRRTAEQFLRWAKSSTVPYLRDQNRGRPRKAACHRRPITWQDGWWSSCARNQATVMLAILEWQFWFHCVQQFLFSSELVMSWQTFWEWDCAFWKPFWSLLENGKALSGHHRNNCSWIQFVLYILWTGHCGCKYLLLSRLPRSLSESFYLQKRHWRLANWPQHL